MKQQSRADRLAAVLNNIDASSVDSAVEEIEMLKEELQNWLDGMPENLQSSLKADQLQEAIDKLDEIQDALQDALDSIDTQINETVDFPGMF